MFEQDSINRTGFGLKKDVQPELQADYHSPLIETIKAQGNRIQVGRFDIRLAEEFGFCYGVDRAIDYAYETRMKFPDKRIFLTNEIIHNPRVNIKMQEMGIEFLWGPYSGDVTIGDLTSEDVVLLPAFGISTGQLKMLQAQGCILVDTTCGSVMSVWKRVESYSRDGFTSIIHGKYDHEETQATSSRALVYPEGKYLIVKDKEEAQMVCDYIEKGGDKDAFLKHFESAYSPGFNPDEDLKNIGCANQTTMLSSESMEIANMLQDSMRIKFGKESANKQFRHFDTICSATQDRQDAVMKLIEEPLDLMIVVGGFNSSNTGHLVEISLKACPSFHVKDAACILSREKISHKKVMSTEVLESENWLPEGPIKLGVTAGASTPNRVIEEVIERILEVAGEKKHLEEWVA